MSKHDYVVVQLVKSLRDSMDCSINMLPCPSPSPRACSNSCPLSWWCHPTISSSVVPFSSCLQSFPASGSFLMSRLFASGCQSTGDSTSASVLPMNIQDWFPLGLTYFLQHHSSKVSIFCAQPSLWSDSHIHMWLREKL